MDNQGVEAGPFFSIKNTSDGLITGGVGTKAIDSLRRKSDEPTRLNSLRRCSHMADIGTLQDVIVDLLVQAGRLLRVLDRIKERAVGPGQRHFDSLSAFGKTICNYVSTQQSP